MTAREEVERTVRRLEMGARVANMLAAGMVLCVLAVAILR